MESTNHQMTMTLLFYCPAVDGEELDGEGTQCSCLDYTGGLPLAKGLFVLRFRKLRIPLLSTCNIPSGEPSLDGLHMETDTYATVYFYLST